MENMEPKINNAEMSPQSFTSRVRAEAARVFSQMKKNLSDLKEGIYEMPQMPEGMKEIRPGNFSDELRVELHAKAAAAEKTFEELPQGAELSKEDFHKRQLNAKLVEFYKLQEEFFSRLAEAKDDPELTELSLAMWSEIQETYATCLKEFSPDLQKPE